ncbi:MAG: hydantoinase/oxoprolinase family protein [Desulfotomaculales bacterium]
MYVGVDVGGTYTYAVLIDKGLVRATAKVPTGEDILSSLLEALDGIITRGFPAELINKMVFSTTMITNLIAEKKYDRVGLIVMPGPGLSYKAYNFPPDTQFISGAIDYRGREIAPLDFNQLSKALNVLAAKNYRKVAVVGKFSSRNNVHEMKVQKYIQEKFPDWHCEVGHKVAGRLNFPRRVMTTYLACATREKYQVFLSSVQEALAKRSIEAPVFILKADGGTFPLSHSSEMAIETIFSGPAASALGVQALTPAGETAVVVDIGGTTTDLALLLGGQPLLSSKGARVNDYLTHVRTLAVKSVPIGGDSACDRVGKDIIVYSERMGLPYCLGGPLPTPTDALRVLGLVMLGEEERARRAMNMLGEPIGLSPEKVARRIVSFVCETIAREITQMFSQWEQEPAYRVWEVLQKKKVRPSTVVGVGGGAAGFLTQIAARLGCSPVIPPYAPMANAIGAAVARPTVQVSLHADTERKVYTILEEGYQDRLEDPFFDEQKAIELAKAWLSKRIARYGLEKDLKGLEVTRHEVFNVVRDWITVGRLYDIVVQSQRGITYHVGAEVSENGA